MSPAAVLFLGPPLELPEVDVVVLGTARGRHTRLLVLATALLLVSGNITFAQENEENHKNRYRN